MRAFPASIRLLAQFGAAALALAACGTDSVREASGVASDAVQAGELPTLTVTAADHDSDPRYEFDLPDTVPAGPTRISLENIGEEVHHAQLFKLDDGATVDDVEAALATGDPVALVEYGTYDGGTGVVAPGTTSTADAVVDLAPGTYVLLCFVENADGVAHGAAGMMQPFDVTPNGDPAPLPEVDAEIDLVDYAFEAPAELPGDAMVLVTNPPTTEPHEMNIARLDENTALNDVVRALEAEESGEAAGPPPFTPVGGTQALLPGASQLLQLNLEPGEYLLACFIPSIVDGVPHVHKGMIGLVSIT
ncbi:MAG: hypothetical protein ACT4PI_15595 [Actinomycetota bacterium]